MYPIKDPKFSGDRCLNISQGWGENPEYYKKVFGIPYHNGIDFCYIDPTQGLKPGEASYGKPILSAFSGQVYKTIFNTEHSTKGNGLYIRSDDCEAIYWHLKKILVNVGDKVKEGQQMGEMGNSGEVFPKPTEAQPLAGTHLHFGIRLLKNGVTLNQDNGLDGYINPTPYLINNDNEMFSLYGNSQTKEQYIKGKDDLLHRIANLETLEDYHKGGIINKKTIVWLSPTEFAVHKIGNTWLSFNDN